jgi:CubicO group peptidase (beta-lactamase class C family)
MIASCWLALVLAHPLIVDEPPFPRAEPAAMGINPAALEQLKERATQAKSDALMIVKDGKLIVDWTFDQPVGPIEAMSATKSIVNLAIGRLIDQKKIRSLDQPVADFYPEWNQGRKRQITIRHLLNHTSGLQNDSKNDEIYVSPDFVQLALAAELSDDPGARFFYNNKAVNLLAGIVARASGQSMDVYIGEQIFRPMGITNFRWSRDKAGNPHGLAGLEILAIDLVKIGQMMLDGGTWRGYRVVSEEWVRVSTTEPGQPYEPNCGLLWWLVVGGQSYVVDDQMIADFKAAGLTEPSVKKLEAIQGKIFEEGDFWATIRPIVREDEVVKHKIKELNEQRVKTGRPGPKRVPSPTPQGFAAAGYRGQRLVVIPRLKLVAVRQHRFAGDHSIPSDEFYDFPTMLLSLVMPPQPRPETAASSPPAPVPVPK